MTRSADNAPATRAAHSGSGRVLAVPMLREDVPIGAHRCVGGARRSPSRTSRSTLLQTFADQAVIAIENVRLFTELEAKNRDLTESLEQQTATGGDPAGHRRSQTDLQPVFDTIADNRPASLRRLGRLGHTLRGRAPLPRLQCGPDVRRRLRAGRSSGSRPPPELTVGRCVLAAAVIHVEDVETDPVVSARSREIATRYGWRSALAAPHAAGGPG